MQKINEAILNEQLKKISYNETANDEKELPSDSVQTANTEPPKKPKALLETLWFGLDYGSILTAFSLYKTVETLEWDVSLMNKPADLWTDHYADPENIAGKFIHQYCRVEPVCKKCGRAFRYPSRYGHSYCGFGHILVLRCVRQTGR